MDVPAYVAGLIGPGDRKSIQPMAARTGEVGYDRLHHFIGAGLWDSAPLEATLWGQADALVGGDKAWLIIDDTALPKKGTASVGVAPQYASALGKNANCQTLVSVTLASREVPIMLGLRLFLPESWTSDEACMVKVGVPEAFRPYRTKPAIAIEEIDRVIAAGVRFAVCSRMPDMGSQPLSVRRSAQGACTGRSASPGIRRCIRRMCNSSFLWRDADAPGSTMFRTSHRAPPMPCSTTQNGDRSVGAAGRRGV